MESALKLTSLGSPEPPRISRISSDTTHQILIPLGSSFRLVTNMVAFERMQLTLFYSQKAEPE